MPKSKDENKNVEEGKMDPEMLENMKLDILDMDVVLNNVASSFNLGLPDGVTLDMFNLGMRAFNVELTGKGFLALRLRSPESTAHIFASGKVTLTGNKSVDDAKTSARKVARKVQKIAMEHPDVIVRKCVRWSGSQISVKAFKINTIWASSLLPWNVHLPRLVNRIHSLNL